MQFSDTSTKLGLIQDAEFWTGLGDASISGNSTLLAHFVRLINHHYHKVIKMILQSQDEWEFDDQNITTTYPVATRPLVAGRRDYLFGTALWTLVVTEGNSAPSAAAIKPLRIKRVDITFDGTNYYKAEPIDAGEVGLGIGNDTTVDGRFSKTKPYYDLRFNALWIYPTASAADVTAGGKIRIEFYREPTEFTASSTTTEPGFDESYHRLLSIGASMDWAMAKGLANKNDLVGKYRELVGQMMQDYGSKTEDRHYMFQPAYIDYT